MNVNNTYASLGKRITKKRVSAGRILLLFVREGLK